MQNLTIKWRVLYVWLLNYLMTALKIMLLWIYIIILLVQKKMLLLFNFCDGIFYHLEFHSASITKLKMAHTFSQHLSLMNFGVTVPKLWQLTRVLIHFAVAMFMKMRGEILTWEFLSRQSRSWWPQMRIRKTSTYGLCMAACPLSDRVPSPSS